MRHFIHALLADTIIVIEVGKPKFGPSEHLQRDISSSHENMPQHNYLGPVIAVPKEQLPHADKTGMRGTQTQHPDKIFNGHSASQVSRHPDRAGK
ncbi:hypothetical protein ACFQY9_27435 [Microvirga aerilata]|uniref:hypothetical protein n=1 Tax=Microvirga aerilata TaxID=670292 RepID=UPI003630DD1C